MKKNLLKLSDHRLFSIGSDFSVTGTREDVATELTAIFKAYNINWNDLVSRYQLDK